MDSSTCPIFFNAQIKDIRGMLRDILYADHGFGSCGAAMSFEEWGREPVYRYLLWRDIVPGQRNLVIIGLNPSTADAAADDPTIRRCRRFAKDLGFHGLFMVNLFAYRATDPKDLIAQKRNVIGYRNDMVLTVISEQCASRGMMAIAAWGASNFATKRGEWVRNQWRDVGVKLFVFRLTKNGSPQHPLYLPASTQPIEWQLDSEATK